MSEEKGVPFKQPPAANDDALSENERETIHQTLENMMTFSEHLERGIKLATNVIAGLELRLAAAEREIAELKRRAPKKPAIYNATGERAN